MAAITLKHKALFLFEAVLFGFGYPISSILFLTFYQEFYILIAPLSVIFYFILFFLIGISFYSVLFIYSYTSAFICLVGSLVFLKYSFSFYIALRLMLFFFFFTTPVLLNYIFYGEFLSFGYTIDDFKKGLKKIKKNLKKQNIYLNLFFLIFFGNLSLFFLSLSCFRLYLCREKTFNYYYVNYFNYYYLYLLFFKN